MIQLIKEINLICFHTTYKSTYTLKTIWKCGSWSGCLICSRFWLTAFKLAKMNLNQRHHAEPNISLLLYFFQNSLNNSFNVRIHLFLQQLELIKNNFWHCPLEKVPWNVIPRTRLTDWPRSATLKTADPRSCLPDDLRGHTRCTIKRPSRDYFHPSCLKAEN